MLRRRQATLAALALCALAALFSGPTGSRDPGPAEAQPRSVKFFRVGVLSVEAPPAGLAPTGNALVLQRASEVIQ